MRRLLFARLAQSVIVVAIVATITFFLIHLAPGDPFAFEGPHATEQIREQRRREFGYDRPLPVQFVRYLANVARGDFGYSVTSSLPASQVIASALPRTLLLSGLSLLLAVVFGVGIGVLQAVRHGTRSDRAISIALGVAYAIPDFALALFVMLTLSAWLHLFPTGMSDEMHAYMTPWAVFTDSARHLVLPVLTLTLLTTAVIARYQRAALLEILPLDFIRTARAKGLSERRVIATHALRNALGSVIALMGLLLPAMVGGAFFIEYVFGWPGMGKLTLDSLSSRDYDVVTGAVIVSATVVTLGNLFADLLHAAIDPRIRAD